MSLTDPDDKLEFTLPFVDGVWPMGPNEKGAYIVANEEIGGSTIKVIYEVGFVDSVLLDATTGEQNVVPTMAFEKVAKLDAQSLDPVVTLYINKLAKYGVAIYQDGAIEIFEYDESFGDW